MVLSPPDAVRFAADARAHGRCVVFTNGVFDILHPGHVRYLRDARALGDLLIVGINSDRSARSLGKGPERPIIAEHERAEVLAALRSVDAVTIFDDATPLHLITALQPHVLVKGADWGEGEIVGREVVEGGGGRVVRVKVASGYSTTALVNRVRAVAMPNE
jgi:D-beta-D-heptose 7-phosphate kinase/D-beta-D-heptose 1-phosphate adenosyltransferase